MFDIGLGELVFIFIVFLVLFGPKSLPDLARKTATVLNKVKQAQAEFQSQINSISNDIQSTIEIDKTNAGIKLDDIKKHNSGEKKRSINVQKASDKKSDTILSTDITAESEDHSNSSTKETDQNKKHNQPKE